MFYITISNGLLKDNHRKRMGNSIWEFMWILDKVTKIDKNGIGLVLGGKPIKLKDIANDLGIHENTVSEDLKKLEKEGYIEKIIAPYGIVIKVKNTKKRFNQNSEPEQKRGSTKTVNLPKKTVNLPSENSEPNKTIQYDNTIDNNTNVLKKISFGNPFINELQEMLKKEAGLPTLSGTIKENRNYCNLAIKKWNKETVEGIIKVGTKLKFHKNNLTGFKYLYYNGEKIIKAYQDQKPKVLKI